MECKEERQASNAPVIQKRPQHTHANSHLPKLPPQVTHKHRVTIPSQLSCPTKAHHSLLITSWTSSVV
jgi:hypothetical protein